MVLERKLIRKQTIRYGVFETNSSLVHSLTICSEEDFNKWKSGEYLFDTYKKEFVLSFTLSDKDKQKAKEEYIRNQSDYMKDWEELPETAREKYFNEYVEKNDLFDYYDNKTYDDYFDNNDLETFEQRYTTNSGEVIVAFGRFGYDG